MRHEKIGSHDVVIYDSIDELPMKRFHRFNKMMLVDSGVGSDLTGIDQHLAKIIAFAKTKKIDEVVTEAHNMRMNFYFVINGISPKYLAFAALVAELDGEKCDDISDDGLQKIVDKLSDIEIASLDKVSEDVKKKIEEDLVLYFPQMFEDSTIKEYYDLIRNRTIAQLQLIIHDGKGGYDDEVERITTELMIYNKPNLYSGSESIEVQFDKQFDKMCHIISYHLNVSPKDYTVTEYYSAFDYIKELIKAKKASMKIK